MYTRRNHIKGFTAHMMMATLIIIRKKKLYVYMYLPIHAINIQISSDEIQYTYISVKPRNLCMIAFQPYNLESQILGL